MVCTLCPSNAHITVIQNVTSYTPWDTLTHTHTHTKREKKGYLLHTPFTVLCKYAYEPKSKRIKADVADRQANGQTVGLYLKKKIFKVFPLPRPCLQLCFRFLLRYLYSAIFGHTRKKNKKESLCQAIVFPCILHFLKREGFLFTFFSCFLFLVKNMNFSFSFKKE